MRANCIKRIFRSSKTWCLTRCWGAMMYLLTPIGTYMEEIQTRSMFNKIRGTNRTYRRSMEEGRQIAVFSSMVFQLQWLRCWSREVVFKLFRIKIRSLVSSLINIKINLKIMTYNSIKTKSIKTISHLLWLREDQATDNTLNIKCTPLKIQFLRKSKINWNKPTVGNPTAKNPKTHKITASSSSWTTCRPETNSKTTKRTLTWTQRAIPTQCTRSKPCAKNYK